MAVARGDLVEVFQRRQRLRYGDWGLVRVFDYQRGNAAGGIDGFVLCAGLFALE